MFSPESIRNRVNQRPFIPVRFTRSSGETIDVYHPDLIMVGIRDVTVGINQNSHRPFYTDVTRLAIMHITAMTDLPVPVSPDGNGTESE